ncbi:hypothetical protein QYE76_066594 [Lolium multiflorum]|uniref:Transposon protein, putative, CACTA, En/Spm sub-class n=1 Tax=Lolium multiflorum TaxID=4521 RepID=A0AAD8SBN5_LOLMU|nr:hypothetical protein QYE76_066594 [Lolium multiflorum]
MHLLRHGFMPSYNCWTKHGERGVIMEEDEEGDDIDESYLDHFGDTFMDDAEGGEGEGEGDQEEARDEPADDLGRTIADARSRCETEKERENLDRMLEDHKKSLYPGCDNGLKKLGCTLDLLRWKAHEVRKRGKHYNGKADHRPKPAERTGAEVFDMIKDLKVIFGKGPGGQSIPKGADGHAPMWKKKSIFWELEYWKVLDVRSAIDVMHVTKNICVNLLSFLGVYGKTNDTKEARQDQQRLKDPDDQHPEWFQGRASYALTKEEKVIFFECLSSIKVINPEVLPRLQNDVVQCLVSFELVFPPSFFNIMTHLLVHLVEEISILGPVFLHNMFPFERFMGVLKKYVRNRARPEGSIAKGYGNEEVIEFCVDFVPDLKPIGLPRSRHEGRLSGKGTIGRKSTICMDGHSLTEAHHTVLTNSSLVAPYFEKHKNILRSDNPGKPESWIRKAHMETFGSWLRKHLMSDNVVVDQLYMLAKTPSSTITTFQGYEINGNTFYTIAQDKKSTNQNSGVRFDAATENGKKVTYYGYIKEIWELDYGPSFKVPLFRCKWFKLTGGGVKVDQQYGMTMVDFNNLGYLDEPFVLAKDVAQVFYVKDMSSKPRKRKDKKTISTSCDDPKRHIVLSGKRNIVGVEDKTDMSEDYNMFGEIPPFKVNTDLSIKPSAGSSKKSSTSSSKRGATKTLKPGETYTIEVVDSATGRPLEPQKHATKFINQCGAVVRDNVSITLQEWNEPKKARLGFTFVDKRTKKDCFKKLMEHFILPPEYHKFDEEGNKIQENKERRRLVKHFALGKMAETFRKFKQNLARDYVNQNKTPEFKGQVLQDDDPYGYRSRKRKSDRDADVVARLASEVDEMKKTLTILVQERSAAGTHEDHPADLGSQQRRSSVASTEVQPATDAPEIQITAPEPPRYPVDDVKEMKECHLHYPTGNMSTKVAIGSALPCEPGALHHNNPIADGYARVTVEEIVPGFEDLEIDIATPEGERRLGGVKRQFILWKKKFIKFPDEAPRRTSPPPSGGGGGVAAAVVVVVHLHLLHITKVPEPSLKPLIRRPWELSVEENAAVVAAQHEKWKADCKKKREPEPKPVYSDKQKKWAKSFLTEPSQAAKNLPDDYSRELRRQALMLKEKQELAEKQEKKALEEAEKELESKKEGKQVAQLGEQSKQSIAPLIVKAAGPDAPDIIAAAAAQGLTVTSAREQAANLGLTLRAVLGLDEAPIMKDVVITYVSNGPLVEPAQEKDLPPQMTGKCIEAKTVDSILPEAYIEKIPFPTKMKEYSVITSVVNKSAKKPIEPEEQINVEPAVAIVKDLVTENVEDGHIIFCEDASNIVSHPSKSRKASVPMLSVRIGDHCYYGLCDIGASISAIPYELYREIMHEIGSCELEDIDVVIRLANRETISPIGIVRDVEVLCDCKKEKVVTKFAGESYEFNFSKFAKTPYEAELPNDDFRVEQLASIALAPTNPLQQYLEDHESEVFREERNELDEIFLRQPILKHDLPVEDLGTTPPPKEDPVFDLKPLPDNLKYACIDDKKTYPIIISAKLSDFEEEILLEILKKHRGAIGYTLDDLKGISPSICQHAINMEDDAKPVVEH